MSSGMVILVVWSAHARECHVHFGFLGVVEPYDVLALSKCCTTRRECRGLAGIVGDVESLTA